MYPAHKNRHLRRGLIGLLIFACTALAVLFLYLQTLPEITVINRSDQVIEEVLVELPASRVVFDAIEPGEQSTILHSGRQPDGAYRYRIAFRSAPATRGECGYVTGTRFGKRLQMIVEDAVRIECRERQGWF
jgi:hypothetical protein